MSHLGCRFCLIWHFEPARLEWRFGTGRQKTAIFVKTEKIPFCHLVRSTHHVRFRRSEQKSAFKSKANPVGEKNTDEIKKYSLRQISNTAYF